MLRTALSLMILSIAVNFTVSLQTELDYTDDVSKIDSASVDQLKTNCVNTKDSLNQSLVAILDRVFQEYQPM